VTETTTRLPAGAPLIASPEAPELVVITGVMFMVFLAGAVMQVRRLRAAATGLSPARPSARPI
jgi:hypothetical protein